MREVIVIGGGAAGMLAALAAAESGGRVSLYEKNEKLGKKLFITGKGRCNVTNACGAEELTENVMSNPKFLYSAFSRFDNHAMMRLLEENGCRLKVERGNRVFPVSDHSSDVIAALAGALSRRGVRVHLHTEVKEILLRGAGGNAGKAGAAGKASAAGKAGAAGVRLADGRAVYADAVIIATGGLSYASTGSTGDGYRFAQASGHRLVETSPGLVPLTVRESWCRELMGLSLRNVAVRMVMGGKEIYSGFGEMLFTHFGVSGPLILSGSSYYAKACRKLAGRGPDCKLFLDLKPALNEEQLDRRILKDLEANGNRQFKNALGALFPAKLIPVMVDLSGIDPEKKGNGVTKEERRRFARLIKNLPLTVTGTGDYAEAVITIGGVDVRDVDPGTMCSRKVENLYFAGEVLDLDALTGGYNLQIAWSTGHLAGMSAGKEKDEKTD